MSKPPSLFPNKPFPRPIYDSKAPQVAQLQREMIHFPDLKFGEVLGQGAYGRVYKAAYRGECVAVKLYDFRGALTPKEQKKVSKEADIMGRLNSEYLVDFRGMCLEPRYCLVMEYCNGGTLRARLDQPREITLLQQMHWVREVSHGLFQLHDKRIVHRDIKAENIFLVGDKAKVGDFGLSVIKLNSASLSVSSIAGTPSWMAPELFNGKPNSLETDIFSLGMLLWEVISRKKPFKRCMRETIVNTVLAGGREELPSPCPRVFQLMITACQHADPKQRPTAERVHNEFVQAISSLESIPAPVSQRRDTEIKKLEQELRGLKLDKMGEEKQRGKLKDSAMQLQEPQAKGATLFQAGYRHYLLEQYNLASPFFEQSVQCGYPLADLFLARIYRKKPEGEGNLQSKNCLQNAEKYKSWFIEQEKTGDPEAQFFLGRFYEDVEKDDKRAETLYLKAADQGYPRAQFELGLRSAKKKQLSEAVGWYKKAAEGGDAQAQCELGYIFRLDAEGVQKNEKTATDYFHKAASQGHPRAQRDFAECCEKEKHPAAYFWYAKAAAQGIRDAQFKMALYYKDDQKVESKERAVYWYLQAAQQEHMLAQYHLGECYASGRGVLKNGEKAIHWFRKAAQQRHVDAQYELGWLYEEGQEDIPQDQKEAARWYRQAADQGHRLAQYNLGLLYASGLGVPKDGKEAVNLLTKSIQQGHVDAQHALGWVYETGQGDIPRDQKEATKWYRQAAEQGFGKAQYVLGCRYSEGIYVRRDVQEGIKWFQKAVEQGYPGAAEQLQKLKSESFPGQNLFSTFSPSTVQGRGVDPQPKSFKMM